MSKMESLKEYSATPKLTRLVNMTLKATVNNIRDKNETYVGM